MCLVLIFCCVFYKAGGTLLHNPFMRLPVTLAPLVALSGKVPTNAGVIWTLWLEKMPNVAGLPVPGNGWSDLQRTKH